MGNSPDSYLAFIAFKAPAAWLASRGNMAHLHSRWKGGKSSSVAVAMAIFLFAFASQIGQQSGAGSTSKYAISDAVNSFSLFLKNGFVTYPPIKITSKEKRICS